MLKKWLKKPENKETAVNPAQTSGAKKTDSLQQSAKKSHKKASEPAQKSHRPERKNKPAPKPWDISQFKVEADPEKVRFHDLDLNANLMHGIADIGYQYCSPIQASILPHTLRGQDAIGKAQTGTGKTAAFLITVIDDLLINPLTQDRYLREPRALIIAPTRELVVQISDDAKALSKYCNLKICTLIGGANYDKQKHDMDNEFVDIVVATPGRLIDFTSRGDLYLDRVETLVMDEADRMLDMGFIPQVKRIIRQLPGTESRQTQLFSATFSEDIIGLSKQWTHEPVFIEIEPESVATDTVEQKVYLISKEDKLKVLMNILKAEDTTSTIIFTNRRDQSQRLYEKIRGRGLEVGVLTGEISQHKRTRTLEDFKKGKINILVATDVVGRGIHIDNVSHVINYNLPEDPEDYIHRIGRTGRAGAMGISICLACEDEVFEIPTIEELLGNKLHCEVPPEALMK